MSVYLKMFHGRNKLDEVLEDWGFEGPTIGPCEFFHTTYASDVKFYLNNQDQHLPIVEGCLYHEGKFYGDWSITSEAQ